MREIIISGTLLLVLTTIVSGMKKPLNLRQVTKANIVKSASLIFPLALTAVGTPKLVNAVDDCSNGVCKCGKLYCSADSKDIEWFSPARERIFDTNHKSFLPAIPEKFLMHNLKERQVVTIGSVHSDSLHHRIEFDIIKYLSRVKNPKNLAIGLECFYRQHQRALDRFIYLHQNFAKLKTETKWDETWGFDLNYYAKLFNFAAKNQVRLVGLNLPVQVAKLVTEVGIAALPAELKEVLPPVDLQVEKHRQMFFENLQLLGYTSTDFSASTGLKSTGLEGAGLFERMYEAQTLWEEYMSESASMFLKSNPETTLVVLAGKGHVKGRVSIPDRIAKRTNSDPFVIVPEAVEWSEVSGLPKLSAPTLTAEDADWIWYTQKGQSLA